MKKHSLTCERWIREGFQGGMDESESVKVVVRCRPLSAQEINQGHKTAVSSDTENNVLRLRNPASSEDPERTFAFDAVFGPDTDQMRVYNVAARPIVENVLKGYNGTIFAYGQTGTGKTHTMTGDLEKAEMKGIIPNSFAHVFDHIANCGSERTFLVRVSYMEIYNEEVRDLLAKEGQGQNLEIKERPDVGVYVKNLSSVTVSSASHMLKIMEFGNKNRKVGATLMNVESSRSHAIFTVTIESSKDGGHVTQGKLQLVDLAGSERQSKTGTTGERLKEAAKINLSLSTLGNVISALVDNKSTHVPYRNSKLTRLLQDSLGGNSKTVMIANVGPASYNYDESLSTLRYANRAKNIQNVARINEDPKDALLRKFQTELATLRAQLEEDEENGEESAEGLSASLDDLRRSRGGAAWEEKMAAMEKELAGKREELEARKGLEEETRSKLTEELEEREKELRRAREEHESLRAKLGQIESKLIVGGENLLEKAEQQARLLSESNRELELAREQEMRLKERLAARNHEHEKIEENYSSLQDQTDSVTQKLTEIVGEIKMTRAELSDVEMEHQREMEGLLESVRHLRKQLLLNMTIINEFIPDEYLELIEKYVVYDEEKGEWQLKAIAYTGNNIRTEKLPPPPSFDPIEHRPPEALFYSYRRDLGEKTSTAPRPSTRSAPRRKSTAQQIKALLS